MALGVQRSKLLLPTNFGLLKGFLTKRERLRIWMNVDIGQVRGSQGKPSVVSYLGVSF